MRRDGEELQTSDPRTGPSRASVTSPGQGAMPRRGLMGQTNARVGRAISLRTAGSRQHEATVGATRTGTDAGVPATVCHKQERSHVGAASRGDL